MDQSTHAIVHFPDDNIVEIVATNWFNDARTLYQYPEKGEKGVKN